MRKGLIVFLVLLVAGGAGAYLYSGTPKWGQSLPIKNVPIKSVELYWDGTASRLTGAECAQVAAALECARQSPVPGTPSFGTLELRYADGSSASYTLSPARRFSALEVAGDDGGYAISMDEIMPVFRSVGLMRKDQ